MNLAEEDIEIGGYALRRYVFHPMAGIPVRGSAFLLHGQGDSAERYGEYLQPFLQKGIICVATDFPGHGHSEGIRGHIPGIRIIDQIAASNLDRCHELAPAADTNPGILGHSAGGLLALREVLERPNLFGFSWISSPLLKPEAGKSPGLIRIAGLMARCVPRFTISTGVSRDKCSKIPDPPIGPRDSNVLHTRISAGWGHTLIQTAREVRTSFRATPPQIPVLVTQGLKDHVCPPEYLQNLLQDRNIPPLTLREFPNALHEPFADDTKSEVFLAVTQWLEQINGL